MVLDFRLGMTMFSLVLAHIFTAMLPVFDYYGRDGSIANDYNYLSYLQSAKD
jgi:hypothetical protein